MRAITVCVEYDDILSITLPRNRSLFEDYVIVTSIEDTKTAELATQYDCRLLITDVFYENGAVFNKGAAMEQGFDLLGREDWICVLDADIVLPSQLFWPSDTEKLYVPHRRISEDMTICDDWSVFPVKHEVEFAGYCQIFNARAPWLRDVTCWYSTNWKHAGGCDSDFQSLFPPRFRSRLLWEVLHLGPDHVNWCGRVTERLDGLAVRNRDVKVTSHNQMFLQRKPNYDGERIL